MYTGIKFLTNRHVIQCFFRKLPGAESFYTEKLQHQVKMACTLFLNISVLVVKPLRSRSAWICIECALPDPSALAMKSGLLYLGPEP